MLFVFEDLLKKENLPLPNTLNNLGLIGYTNSTSVREVVLNMMNASANNSSNQLQQQKVTRRRVHEICGKYFNHK
jgi:hypothetical protein